MAYLVLTIVLAVTIMVVVTILVILWLVLRKYVIKPLTDIIRNNRNEG